MAKSDSKQEYRFSKTGRTFHTCHAHGVQDAIKQFRAMNLYAANTPDKYYRERIQVKKNDVWEHV